MMTAMIQLESDEPAETFLCLPYCRICVHMSSSVAMVHHGQNKHKRKDSSPMQRHPLHIKNCEQKGKLFIPACNQAGMHVTGTCNHPRTVTDENTSAAPLSDPNDGQ